HFAVDVDAGDLAKAQGLHEVVHGIHTQLVGQRVKIHVAGFHDGAVHVHNAAALVFGTAEAPAAKHVEAGVVDQSGGRTGARLQGGQRHERLVGGAGRVSAAQGP